MKKLVFNGGWTLKHASPQLSHLLCQQGVRIESLSILLGEQVGERTFWGDTTREKEKSRTNNLGIYPELGESDFRGI
jgi:hypothetical protein